MSVRESIARYSLIIKKLRKNSASFAEIFDYLSYESELQGYNFSVSKRTFQRDLADIRSLYNIDIQFDLSRKGYSIQSAEQPGLSERILEAFDMLNALNLSDRLSDNIYFEKRKPSGTENLYGLLHSIKNQLQIKFTYQKFWEDESTLRHVEPYALKEFRYRWYILAKDLKDNQVKSFALDRVSELDITKNQFQLPVDFNVNEHYKYCFGIVSPNEHKPEEIILSFDPIQGKYIKTLPLHESQQVLIDTEDEFRIKLTLFITHDFFMELLSYGDKVRVIKPESLINDLKSTFKKGLNLYRDSNNQQQKRPKDQLK
jgi:predicted DNA-binding transcriptional regulator YafY